MVKPNLPNDQEFLEILMQNSASSHFTSMRDLLEKQAIEAVEEQIRKKIIDPKDRGKYLKIQLDMLKPEHVFQNNVIELLRKDALNLLNADRSLLEKVPVGAFSVAEMNAFAIKTPQGGAAIALNSSLWLYLKIAFYCVLAIMYRKSPDAFGIHHSDETYAINFIQTIDAIRSGAIIIMTKDGEHSIADCVGPAAPINKFIVATIDIALTFILLHEYGHIYNGHLSGELTRKAAINGNMIDVYLTSHRQEYEADEYAVRHLFQIKLQDPLRHHYVITLAILFLLFDMCEAGNDSGILGTHPKSCDRLERIYSIVRSIFGKHSWSQLQRSVNIVSHIYDAFENFRSEVD